MLVERREDAGARGGGGGRMLARFEQLEQQRHLVNSRGVDQSIPALQGGAHGVAEDMSCSTESDANGAMRQEQKDRVSDEKIRCCGCEFGASVTCRCYP